MFDCVAPLPWPGRLTMLRCVRTGVAVVGSLCWLLGLAGCATVPAHGDAAKSSLSPQEFVEAELISGLPWESSQRASSGGMLYDAYFNGDNGNLLSRPVRTFEAYCEGKGGKLAELESVQLSAKALSKQPIPGEIAAALRSAQASFGKFGCQAGGEMRWVASIEPRALEPVGAAPNWKLRMRLRALSAQELAEAGEKPAPPVQAGEGDEQPAASASGDEVVAEESAQQTTESAAERCKRGQLAACDVARRYRSAAVEGPALEQPVREARRDCGRGQRAACAQLGTAYATGDQAPLNLGQSLRFYRRACGRGDAQSCASVASAFENGLGVRRDSVRATRMYALACRRGEGVACNNAGVLFARGEGRRAPAHRKPGAASARAAQRDLTVALRYFTQGCDRGTAIACTNAGAVKLSAGRRAQPEAAVALLSQGCEAQDAVACAALADLVERGTGVAANPKRAAQLFQRACQAGFTQACSTR